MAFDGTGRGTAAETWRDDDEWTVALSHVGEDGYDFGDALGGKGS